MFSKRTKDDAASASVSRPASVVAGSPDRKGPRIASLITEDMRIDGNLSGDGELHIDGLVRGDLTVARLTVGESGRIEGSVVAETFDCRGRITGSITAKAVHLYATAHVDGDVTHDQLSIEAGAFIQGRCLKMQRQTPAQPVLVEDVLEAAPAA